jgi:hypothetical protein
MDDSVNINPGQGPAARAYAEQPSESSAEELKELPTTELVKMLSQQTSELIRKEFDLAKAEMTEKGKSYGIGAGFFGGAFTLELLSLGALTACFIAALATGMDTWLAALIVAVVYGAAAGAAALMGKQRIDEVSPVPEQTIETVKEDVEWARTQQQSVGR